MKKICMAICIAIIVFGVYTFFNYGIVRTRQDNKAMIKWKYEHAVRP